jgi:ribbon-helix-helix CopG family protein
MKRLQISLEPELDLELARVARQHGISKAEIVRRLLRADLRRLPPLEEDPLVALFGTFRGGEPLDSERHDDVIYG